MITQTPLSVHTNGRGMIEITKEIAAVVAKSDVTTGLCNVYIRHTSASLLISENHDALVLSDLEAFMRRLVPDGDSLYQHVAEGPDDMPSHVRSALTQTSLSIPIINQKLALGTWQGIFLWEHRLKANTRHITVTVMG